jgi:ribosomal-protein-alanine N-acetyltransferase
LHRAAFRGSMGVGLGARYTRALLRHYVACDACLFLVSVPHRSGPVDGYVFGAPLRHLGEIDRRLAVPSAVGMATHPWLLARRAVLAEAWNRVRGHHAVDTTAPDPATTFALVGIGVDPTARGRGVGRALLAGFEQHVDPDAYAACELTVYEDNVAARALYESTGWRCVGPVPGARTLRYLRIPGACGQ